ncbi:restriction endonuclease subunit S [Streptococcus gordonii]|uniref:restriction endonuclease subunit S n=1 Tax=Streptococcus gordonii TaxID=1302 RepID=UPI001CBC8DFD|nr:restriction endonuclease subunit S [Streptococcus gordonii]MBZ2148878.1 restriction endonuclease subunit S [Streptococcus gordonii]
MEKPKIRFLKNKHSWVRNTFEEIAKRRTKSSDNPDLPRIEYQDIISGEGRLNKDLSKNIDCRKGIVFETNDILYGKLRPYLKNWLHPNFNGIAIGDFWVLQARNCDSKFLFSLVQSPKFQRVANDTSGTKMPRSDWKTVSQTEFSIPTSNEEQSAIGSLFCTLDDLLSSYKDNLANYQSLKATMLSKMFPKVGQTVPEIRLDGFEGEWEEKTLGSLGSVAMNKRIFKDETSENGDIPFYKIGTFGGTADAFISKEKFEEYKEKYPYPDIGDILISASGSIGRTVVYNGEDAYYQDSNIVWLKHDQQLDNSYLKQYYGIIKWSGIEGTTIKRLYNKNILETNIFLPPSVAEQQAIGSYFSNLDNLINSYQEKISQLETLKKKLLQDMFI